MDGIQWRKSSILKLRDRDTVIGKGFREEVQQVSKQANGTFEVVLTPQQDGAQESDSQLIRMTIDKTFSGDLTGSSGGQMFAHRTAVEGSAGYVAIEVVTGTLAGVPGSFVLQHSSVMAKGESQQNIVVIPDSGTNELSGLSGSMQIEIDDQGQHSYVFNYEIADQP